jgi:hypothetical protein
VTGNLWRENFGGKMQTYHVQLGKRGAGGRLRQPVALESIL